MSKISKKHKNQIKKAFRDHNRAASTTRHEKIKKPRMKWNVSIGDLVEYYVGDGTSKGIVLSEGNSGYFEILASSGKTWVSAKKIRTIQKSTDCKDDK